MVAYNLLRILAFDKTPEFSSYLVFCQQHRLLLDRCIQRLGDFPNGARDIAPGSAELRISHKSDLGVAALYELISLTYVLPPNHFTSHLLPDTLCLQDFSCGFTIGCQFRVGKSQETKIALL